MRSRVGRYQNHLNRLGLSSRKLRISVCGIAGCVALLGRPIPRINADVRTMIGRIAHRGPDGTDYWTSTDQTVSFGHARLAVIDTSDSGVQPMVGTEGDVTVFNGEIYNYKELRAKAVSRGRHFRSNSDTETILAMYEQHGLDFVHHLRGMFALALWDGRLNRVVLARDRFGIKPLYFMQVGDVLYFASEAKALTPFLASIDPDPGALTSYLTFQNYIGPQTLFAGIQQVMPGEIITCRNGMLSRNKYWDIHYDIDHEHEEAYFVERVQGLLEDSIEKHLQSDVEVGAYLSGGLDSSLIAALASKKLGHGIAAFHGRYVDFSGYDESSFAQIMADQESLELDIRDLSSDGVEDLLRKVIYHLDYPVAGPGVLPQFLVSERASSRLKVILGGQGGDEIFGGYVRYLIGYLEQCLRAAINGTSENGNFVVTLESVIPNLGVLREYQPLLQRFWADGLFGGMDERYLRLINRSDDLTGIIRFEALQADAFLPKYLELFNSENNVRKEAYFDSMTHFDLKTLLPALLQVEDRMSMAHGLESRVPFLDHPLVEFVATIPADVKFKNGELKRLLRVAFPKVLPEAIINRRDKMGFPVPLTEWSRGPLRGYISGLLESIRDRDLPFLDSSYLTQILQDSPRFSRGLWALVSLELWFQAFHDVHHASGPSDRKSGNSCEFL